MLIPRYLLIIITSLGVDKVKAYRILVSAPVPFGFNWGWNWVGLGLGLDLGRLGIRGTRD